MTAGNHCYSAVEDEILKPPYSLSSHSNSQQQVNTHTSYTRSDMEAACHSFAAPQRPPSNTKHVSQKSNSYLTQSPSGGTDAGFTISLRRRRRGAIMRSRD
mmetsp:Transcript_30115/g.56885  ORF Transcript_30115/g.56885 Transcript_30115/m.56885 type:complete len:101 (+) Transcript_30115:46-348(+)